MGLQAKKNLPSVEISALYADKTVVPLPLGILLADESEYSIRRLLGGTILCIQQMRPMVEAGIMTLAPQELPYCDRHLREALPDYSNLEKAARDLYRENEDRFAVYSEAPESQDDDSPAFTIKGPSDFLEHGQMGRDFYEVPRWLKGWRGRKRQKKLSKAMVRRSDLVSELFDDMAFDVAIQQVLGLKYDAKYLTNLPGEAMILSRLNPADDYFARCRETLCAELTHEVPLLADIPMRTVLRVRSEEPEAFLQYRAAMDSIVSGYIKRRRVVGRKEAREIYSDILRPEILRLDSQAKAIRRATIRKATAKAVVAAGVVGLGIFGGFLPTQMAEIIKAVGGVSLLRELGEAFAAVEKNPAEIKNSNFYFLLRLAQEAHP